MKKIILYFLIILASVWLGIKIYQHPGYMLLAYQHWLIESTVWFFLLVLLLLFFLFHFLLNLLKQTVILPKRLERWLNKRRLNKSIERLNKGYKNLILGKWKKAEKNFVKGAKKKPLAFVSYLLAAEAADSNFEQERRNSYLGKAQEIDPKNRFVVDVLEAEFFLNHNQPEQALVTLNKLREQKPNETYLLKLLTETYLLLDDYTHLQPLLPEIKKSKIFPEDVYLELEKVTYLHCFQDRFFSDFSEVQSLWNKLPRHLRHDPSILIAYGDHLQRWNRHNEAEELIRKELKHHYSKEVMAYYVTLKSKAPAKQLALGEKWLKDHSGDPDTLNAMGILCLRNRLWGQAKDYFEASQKINPTAQNYLALGYVYEQLGENERALHYYRKGFKDWS